MKEFSESLNISDNVHFITMENGIVYLSVNGEKQYKKFDDLSFTMKKILTSSLLKASTI